MGKLNEKLNWVILIDDDETNNFITRISIESFRFCKRIEAFTNALKVKEFFEHAEGKYPDLTLLDINMPLFDGFDFLDWYEQNGYTGTTKFIILTNSIRKSDERAANSYADVIGYIEKPLTRRGLAKALSKLT